MFDKQLRQTIGERTKMRRKELHLTQEYLADKLDVNKSTIQRYESGTIDNTKKLVVDGLADALHVPREWLMGEMDELETDVTSRVRIEILDALEEAKNSFPAHVDNTGNEFSQYLLLLLLKEYVSFNQSLETAYRMYYNAEEHKEIAQLMGYNSIDEFNEGMFLREIMHTSSNFLEVSSIIKEYAKNHDGALMQLKNLLEIL